LKRKRVVLKHCPARRFVDSGRRARMVRRVHGLRRNNRKPLRFWNCHPGRTIVRPNPRLARLGGNPWSWCCAHSAQSLNATPLEDYVAQVSEDSDIRMGVPLPMGTHEYGGGVNFAISSRHATRVRLELFDHPISSSNFSGRAPNPSPARRQVACPSWPKRGGGNVSLVTFGRER
jgi:hypothetical protein